LAVSVGIFASKALHRHICFKPAPILIDTPSAVTTAGAAQQPAGRAEDAAESAGAEDEDEFTAPAPLGLSGSALEELEQARARQHDQQQNPTSYAQPPKPGFKPPPRTLQSIGLPADPSEVSVGKDEVSFVVLLYQVRWLLEIW
jgi:hypothetical protein